MKKLSEQAKRKVIVEVPEDFFESSSYTINELFKARDSVATLTQLGFPFSELLTTINENILTYQRAQGFTHESL